MRKKLGKLCAVRKASTATPASTGRTGHFCRASASTHRSGGCPRKAPSSQLMEMEMHAVKGVGKVHAKFNPIRAIDYYRIYFGRGKSCTTISCNMLLGLLLSQCHQHLSLHQKVTVNKHSEMMTHKVLRHPDLVDFVKPACVRDHLICTFHYGHVLLVGGSTWLLGTRERKGRSGG